MLQTSEAMLIGSDDFEKARIAWLELKFGSIWASRRAYPIGRTSTGTDSP